MPPSFGKLNIGWPCSMFPERGGEVSVFESSAAELFMQTAYSSNFRSQHRNPRWALALSAGPRFFDSSYFEYLHRLTDPSLSMTIQVILKYLLADFRNPLPQGRLKSFEKAYKDGTLTVELVKDLSDFIHSPGGMRKPDILGIIAEGDPGRFELHEVCSFKTRGDTKKELDGKLQQLRTQVIPNVIYELESRQNELRTSNDPLIHQFSAEASNWVPPSSLRTCPLGIRLDTTHNVIKVTWACFEPAVDPSTQMLVTPGLLPYHIHEIDAPSIFAVLPASVRKDLKRWKDELAKAAGLRPLQLLPEANPEILAELTTLTRDQAQILAYSSAAVLILIFCVVAAPIVLDALAVALPAAATGATAGEAVLPGAVVSAQALIAEAPAATATAEGIYPLAERYAVSLARAAARAAQGAGAPPPP